ncbi:MAG: hypothetical protein EPO08_13055 [Rhodospirillaceae bacterium]|nr:MAG: hypothetical protein EPO08_13055 [Rhodospirillaceae bacterium]
MKTEGRLRSDEEFVISSLAAEFSGTWCPGENPPDAYLQTKGLTVAVEISTLAQQVSSGGKSKPRISEDIVPIRLANELNRELGTQVPGDVIVILTFHAPISEPRKLKTELGKTILELLAKGREVDRAVTILGNEIRVHISVYDQARDKRIVGIVTNRNSSANILVNAWSILHDRIAVKAEKCKKVKFDGPLWLALLNDYWLADKETYQQAFDRISVDHPFERIILVSSERSIYVLERSSSANT